MDELEIQGKKYISSKRAAELTGYAKDYVGQLARAGKIPGTRVGRAWYVEEVALTSHMRSDAEKQVEVIENQKLVVSPLQLRPKAFISPATLKAMGYGARNLPETWSPALYVTESYDLIPNIQKNEANKPQNTILSGIPVRIRIIDRQAPRLAPPDGIRKINVSEKAKHIRARRRFSDKALSLGAVAAALGVLLFFSSGFLFSSHVSASAPNGVYAANLEVGFENVWGILMKFPPFATGVLSLVSFFNVILHSFSEFLDKGTGFILWIIHSIVSLV